MAAGAVFVVFPQPAVELEVIGPPATCEGGVISELGEVEGLFFQNAKLGMLHCPPL